MPITLTTQMANGNLLFRPSTVPGAAFTQLHIDIINASPTALALYESAARNNVPVTIAAPKPDGSGGGTFYNPNPSTDGTAPNGTIVIDARDFTSQTNPAASPAANAVANALTVVSAGVHEAAHALDHLDGTPLVSASTFSTPSAYALARAGSEGHSLAAEGKVKTELLDKVFTAPGQAEAITVTRSSYYVGDPSADAHLHMLFTDATRTAEQQIQSAREFGTLAVLDYVQSTSRLNYLAADLKAYASYWSGIPIEQIADVSIEDTSQIWVVSARKGVTETTVFFGEIDTTKLPGAATQAISRLEITPDADGNQLVKHYNYASGILTSTLSDLDGHLLNQYQIPIPTGSAGLAPSPATSPSPSPIAQASPELNSDTVGQLANFFRQTPEAATTPFTLAQNSTVILDTGTSRQIYDLATGQLTAQVDANGGGFIVRGIDNSAYYFNPGELRLDTLSGQIVPAAHSQATLDYFGAAAVAYYVSGTGSAPAQPNLTPFADDFYNALVEAFTQAQAAGPGVLIAAGDGYSGGIAFPLPANTPANGSSADYVNGSDLQSDQAYAQREATQQFQSAVNLANTILSLANFDDLSALQRLSLTASLVNAVTQQIRLIDPQAISFTGVSQEALGVLGFLSALESGNALAQSIGLIYLGDQLGFGFSAEIAQELSAALGVNVPVDGIIPGLNVLLAFSGDNDAAKVSSLITLGGQLGWIPGGQLIGAVISLIGVFASFFGDDDIPTTAGYAVAEWNAQGQIVVRGVDEYSQGGGANASSVLTPLVAFLQEQLANQRDSQGNPVFGINPAGLSPIGFFDNPDGARYAATGASFHINRTGPDGQLTTQYYDTLGNAADGSAANLQQAYLAYAVADAVLPNWLVMTAYEQYKGPAAAAAALERQIAEHQLAIQAVQPYYYEGDPYYIEYVNGEPYWSSVWNSYWSGDTYYYDGTYTPKYASYLQLSQQLPALQAQLQGLRDQAQQVLNDLPTQMELGQRATLNADGNIVKALSKGYADATAALETQITQNQTTIQTLANTYYYDGESLYSFQDYYSLHYSWDYYGGGYFPFNEAFSADAALYTQLNQQLPVLQNQLQNLRNEAQQVLSDKPTQAELGQRAALNPDSYSHIIKALAFTLPGFAAGPAVAANTVRVNLDADGHLEQLQWVRPDQALLGIDYNASGRIEVQELLTADLAWLDANHDGLLNAIDPAYHAIRLWVDVYGDADSLTPVNTTQVVDGQARSVTALRDETFSLQQAGISAIDFNGGSLAVVFTGSQGQTTRYALTEQTLSGTTLGVTYNTHIGVAGVLRTDELAGGASSAVLLAANTREYDASSDGITEVFFAPEVYEQFGFYNPYPSASTATPKFLATYTYYTEEERTGYLPESEIASYLGITPIRKNAPGDVLIARNDRFTGLEDTPLRIALGQLLVNDTHADGRQLTVGPVFNAIQGNAIHSGDYIDFVPDANFSGQARFTYTVTDNAGNTSYAQAFLDVLPVNDAPSIYRVNYDSTLDGLLEYLVEGYPYFSPYDDPSKQSGQVFAYDADSPGALTFSVQSPARGSATINSSTGAWQYQGAPGDNFTGADPFNVVVTDAQGAFAVVQINTTHAPPARPAWDYWGNYDCSLGCP